MSSSSDIVTTILSQGLLGALLIVAGMIIKYLYKRIELIQAEKEDILRKTLQSDFENTQTLRKAIDLFEARTGRDG